MEEIIKYLTYIYMHYCPNCGAKMDENEHILKYTDQETMMLAT